MRKRDRTCDVINLIVGIFLLAVVAVPAISMQVSDEQNKPAEKMDKKTWTEYVLKTHYKVKDYEIIADVVSTASDQENIPVQVILAIMKVESNFNPYAVSKCHAKGLMQVRPIIWDGETPYNLHDKYENVFAGAWILSQYRTELGSIDNGIKAYNIGITHFINKTSPHAAMRYHKKVMAEIITMKTLYPMELSTD